MVTGSRICGKMIQALLMAVQEHVQWRKAPPVEYSTLVFLSN